MRKREIFLEFILCHSVEQKGTVLYLKCILPYFSVVFGLNVSLEKKGDYSRGNHGEFSI